MALSVFAHSHAPIQVWLIQWSEGWIHLSSNDGIVLGISISKQLFDDNPDFSGRYLDGVEMYAFLLLYIEQIKEFCHLFSAEFEAIFLTKPTTFFRFAEESWLEIIEKS